MCFYIKKQVANRMVISVFEKNFQFSAHSTTHFLLISFIYLRMYAHSEFTFAPSVFLLTSVTFIIFKHYSSKRDLAHSFFFLHGTLYSTSPPSAESAIYSASSLLSQATYRSIAVHSTGHSFDILFRNNAGFFFFPHIFFLLSNNLIPLDNRRFR